MGSFAEVRLLSGRCCNQIFDLTGETVKDVLRQCAGSLGLDDDQLLESATLMHGTCVITDLKEYLEAGKIYELTLVMG